MDPLTGVQPDAAGVSLMTEPWCARELDLVNLHWPRTLEDAGNSTCCSKSEGSEDKDALIKRL